MTLNIDQESCIKCGKCVRVCPRIYSRKKEPERRSGWYVWKAASFAGIAWTYVRRLRVAQRIPAGENAYDRLQPNAYAGAGDVADQVTPFQPDIDLEARPQGDAGQDRGGRSFRADGYKLPKPLVHRRHRSAKATAGEHYTIGVFDSLAKLFIESRRENVWSSRL